MYNWRRHHWQCTATCSNNGNLEKMILLSSQFQKCFEEAWMYRICTDQMYTCQRCYRPQLKIIQLLNIFKWRENKIKVDTRLSQSACTFSATDQTIIT